MQRPAHKFPSRVRRGGRGPGRATQWGQLSRKSASRLVVQVPVVHFVCGSRGNAASPQPFAACPALQPIRTVERTCPRQPPSQGGDVGAFVCHPAIQFAAVPTTSPQPKDSITPRYLWRARPGVSFFLPELLSLVWTWVTFPGAGQSRQSRPPRGPVCCSLPSGQVPPTLGWDPQHRPGLAVAHRLARGSASRVTDGVHGQSPQASSCQIAVLLWNHAFSCAMSRYFVGDSLKLCKYPSSPQTCQELTDLCWERPKVSYLQRALICCCSFGCEVLSDLAGAARGTSWRRKLE